MELFGKKIDYKDRIEITEDEVDFTNVHSDHGKPTPSINEELLTYNPVASRQVGVSDDYSGEQDSESQE